MKSSIGFCHMHCSLFDKEIRNKSELLWIKKVDFKLKNNIDCYDLVKF